MSHSADPDELLESLGDDGPLSADHAAARRETFRDLRWTTSPPRVLACSADLPVDDEPV